MANVSNQPWYVGQTYPAWEFPVKTDAGNDDLTNVNVSNFTLYFKPVNGSETAGTGTWTLKSTYPAALLYKPSTADVSAAFNGYLVVKSLYPPSNSTTDEPIFDPQPFVISTS